MFRRLFIVPPSAKKTPIRKDAFGHKRTFMKDSFRPGADVDLDTFPMDGPLLRRGGCVESQRYYKYIAPKRISTH